MALDNLVLKTIVKKMEEELVGAFFDRIFPIGENSFVLPYHSGKNTVNKGRGSLVLCLDPSHPFISYSFDKFTKVEINTPFYNALKKLQGTKIKSVEKISGDRIVKITSLVDENSLETINTSYDLIIELFPQHPNCYLIPYPYKKITAVFHQKGDLTSPRYMARGLPYLFPPLKGEINENTPENEAYSLLSFSTGKKFRTATNEIGYKKALEEMLSSQALYRIENSIEPWHFNLSQAQEIPVENIASFYIQDQKKQAKDYQRKELISGIEKALNTAKKKLKHIKQDLSNAKARLIYKDYALCLLLHQTEIQEKQTKVNFDNMVFQIDGKLNPVENSNKFFKLYNKAKAATKILEPMIETCQNEIIYLQEKLLQAKNGSAQDVLELKSELVEEGYLHVDEKKRKTIKNVKKASPHYIVLEDAKLGYGMNAYQNEELTFKIAKGNDLFFHVYLQAGSHVCLLGNQSDENQLLAAELALYLSDLDSGEIMVCPRKEVKKNPQKRGLVNVLNYSLIHVSKIRESSLKLFKENV